MQSHHLGGLLGADHFGAMTMGLAYRETLLTTVPAFSKSSNSFCTKDECFNGKLYGLWDIGELSPVSISMVTSLLYQYH